MNDGTDSEQPRKRRRRGASLIERAGSVYDFEAVLRARVVMPDQAAPQSQVIDGRTLLVTNAAKYAAQFMLNPPRPPHWGGYRLVPDSWQFWQGRKSRLHDRLRYTQNGDQWLRERLAP